MNCQLHFTMNNQHISCATFSLQLLSFSNTLFIFISIIINQIFTCKFPEFRVYVLAISYPLCRIYWEKTEGKKGGRKEEKPYKDFLTSVPTGNTGHTQIVCNTFKMSLIKRQLLKSGARLVLLIATNPYSLCAGRDKEWQWVLEFRKTQRGGRDEDCGEKELWSQQARTQERRAGGINTVYHLHLSSGLLSSSHWWNLSGSWWAKSSLM